MRLGFGLKARTRQRVAKAWDTMVGEAAIMVIDHTLLVVAVVLVAIIHTARDRWLPTDGGWTNVVDIALSGAQILLFMTIIGPKGLVLAADLVVGFIAGYQRIRAAWTGGAERQNSREK